MITRLRYPKGYQFFDANGEPLALGQLWYYAAGTTAPQNTYADSGATVPNANPVVLDGSGRLSADIYLTSAGPYKEVLTDGTGATVAPWPDDNIPAAIGTFQGDSGSGGTAGLVPAPSAGDAAANKFLSAGGVWSVPAGSQGSSNTNLGISETPSSVAITSSTGGGVTIPAATSQAAGVLDSARAVKIDGLSAVAMSGSYNDLSNKPTIPAYSPFTGATAGAGGTAGLVPAPAAGQQGYLLRGDATWAALSSFVAGADLDNAARLGIGTTDSGNALSVSGATSLFSNSADVRITMSKGGTGNTAAFNFQDNFSTRVQFGLLGSDNFTISVSPDGGTFHSVIAATPAGALAIGSGGYFDGTCTVMDGTASTGDTTLCIRDGAASPGRLRFGTNGGAYDTGLGRIAAGMLAVTDGAAGSTNYKNLTVGALYSGANQVVGARIGGYGTPTGNAYQPSFAAGTVTLANLAAAVAQLIVDLKTHGLIGS